MNLNRIISRIISLILTFAMLLPCNAFAADVNKYEKKAFTYLCFGDSFTRGLGCSDKWDEDNAISYEVGDCQSRNVRGAYPYIVAKTLGCICETENGILSDRDASYWPIATSGQTLSFVLDLLGIEDGFFDTDYLHKSGEYFSNLYEKVLKDFGNPNSSYKSDEEKYGACGSVYELRTIAENADLITIELGMGDVLCRPVMYSLLQVYESLECDEVNKFTSMDAFIDILAQVIENCNAKIIAELFAHLIENAYEGYSYFESAYPKLLEYLKSVNKDARIMIVGVANPAFGIKVSEEIPFPFGSLFSSLTAKMNRQLRQWAKKYGVEYIDMSNVETMSTEKDWDLKTLFSEDLFLGLHPSESGQRQIARAILDAYQGTDNPTNDIRVDLGRLDHVSAVFLDGIKILDYAVEGNVLTVPNRGYFARKLKVYSENEDATAATYYQLSYRPKKGYHAYRIHTTNDISNHCIY